MQIWFYLTDREREELIDFVRSIEGLHVLPRNPGGEASLEPSAILADDRRNLSLCDEGKVAIWSQWYRLRKLNSWDNSKTPLIEWKLPYQREKLIIGGCFELQEFPGMRPHEDGRSSFLAARRVIQAIRTFLEERFVKIDASLFNGPEAIALMNNGHEGVPFDPATTEFMTVRFAEMRDLDPQNGWLKRLLGGG